MLAVRESTLPAIMNGAASDPRACSATDRDRGCAEVRQDERELVATQPRHGVGIAHALRQPLGGLPQHHVARGVAEAVVDRLEVVEVDEEQRERLRLPLRLRVPAGRWSLKYRRFGSAVSAS